jgi:hypothetical protein
VEGPLEKVLRGTWDLPAAAAKYRQQHLREKKLLDLYTRIGEAQEKGDPSAILKVIDPAIAEDPSLEPSLCYQKLGALAKTPGSKVQALAYGRRLVDVVLKENAEGLSNLAMLIVEPFDDKPLVDLVPVALAAALKATALTHEKDVRPVLALARAYFLSGDASKALATQERAVHIAKGTAYERDPTLPKRLQEYQKAAKR